MRDQELHTMELAQMPSILKSPRLVSVDMEVVYNQYRVRFELVGRSGLLVTVTIRDYDTPGAIWYRSAEALLANLEPYGLTQTHFDTLNSYRSAGLPHASGDDMTTVCGLGSFSTPRNAPLMPERSFSGLPEASRCWRCSVQLGAVTLPLPEVLALQTRAR